MHFSIQSNPESTKLEIYVPIQSKSAWTGLDYESGGLIQTIPYSGHEGGTRDDALPSPSQADVVCVLSDLEQTTLKSLKEGILSVEVILRPVRIFTSKIRTGLDVGLCRM